MYTGKLLEHELLGRPCQGKEKKYMPYKEAVKWACSHQPEGWDPTDPPTRWANDLHAYVAEALGLEDWSELEFYTSLDSPFDTYHGVDAFFLFRGRLVTLDITANLHKEEHKADVVVPFDTKGNFRGNLQRIVEEITRKLTARRETA